MRTILAGLRSFRRTPLAGAPLAVEAAVAGVMTAIGVFPANGAGAPATAAFPLDVFFDVKESLAVATGWTPAVALVAFGVLVRGLVLASTLWFADGRPGSLVSAYRQVLPVVAVASLALLPSAALFFAGAAIRYAPFIWVAAALGFTPALFLTRRAMRIDVGAGVPSGRGVPEGPGLLAYGYVISIIAAAMSVLGNVGGWAVGLLVLLLGPVHVLFLLGWREHLKEETFPGGGTLALATTILTIGLLALGIVYDRYIRNPAPVARANAPGYLLLLGGIDSTNTSGALSQIDARDLGYPRSKLMILSYQPSGGYTAEDTHLSPDFIAPRVSDQIAGIQPPRALLGHSQASLILDRILADDRVAPERAAILAPSLPWPPSLAAPEPGESGRGKPGADAARAISWLLDLVGLQTFDIDIAASPVHLDEVIVPEPEIPRLAVWALGDSVWLDHDWRRPGELNIVALTDHVGVTGNSRAINAAQDFFAARAVEDDETSWRGLLAVTLRYAFEPWRPR